MARSIRVVLAVFAVSMGILAAPLLLPQAPEEEPITLIVPAAGPPRAPFDQAQSDAWQFGALNGLFYTLEPHGKKEARFFVPVSDPFQIVSGHRNFHVGSVFHAQHSHDYSYDFKVTKIDAEGIIVAYSGSQGNVFGYSGPVSGQVRLGWRARPAPTPLPTQSR